MRLPDGGRFVAGTEQFSTANELDQDIFEITNDLTIVRGAHTFTLGTHNEFFKFRNLFIRDNFGTYEFASLDTFEAGSAQLYDYSFSLTGDPQFAAKFSVVSARLLRRRPVAHPAELHADLRRPLGQAVLPGHANGQSCKRWPPTATRPISSRRPRRGHHASASTGT